MTLDTDDVRRAAERVEQHDVVERFAKAGLGSRAVIWTLVGLLAASVALGFGASSTDQGGALRAVSQTPGGTVMLLLLALGFFAYSAYRFLCAAVGHRDDEPRKRTLHRLKSGAEGLLYGAAAVSCLRAALGNSPDSEQDTRSVTARVMELPVGRTLVGLIGAAAVVLAIVLFVRALKHHHAQRLEGVPRGLHRALVWLGVAGLGGRSLAIGLIGGFLVNAAVRLDPQEAKGLDASLDTLAQQPFGTGLLLVTAVSFICYGLWSVAEMLWRDV